MSSCGPRPLAGTDPKKTSDTEVLSAQGHQIKPASPWRIVLAPPVRVCDNVFSQANSNPKPKGETMSKTEAQSLIVIRMIQEGRSIEEIKKTWKRTMEN